MQRTNLPKRVAVKTGSAVNIEASRRAQPWLRRRTVIPSRSLDKSNAELAHRMHASGEPVSTIAGTLGVGRATVNLVLAEEADGSAGKLAPARRRALHSRALARRILQGRTGCITDRKRRRQSK